VEYSFKVHLRGERREGSYQIRRNGNFFSIAGVVQAGGEVTERNQPKKKKGKYELCMFHETERSTRRGGGLIVEEDWGETGFYGGGEKKRSRKSREIRETPSALHS